MKLSLSSLSRNEFSRQAADDICNISFRKTRLLIFIRWFTPGYKAGGPTRAIQNFVDLFGNVFEIFIITGDRDLGDNAAYADIKLNTWDKSNDDFKVIYLDPKHQASSIFRQQIRDLKPDAIYLNSFYDFRFSILPLVVAKAIGYKGKIVMAPRGMLKESAIKFKRIKKQLFIWVSRNIRIFNGIYFQATDQQEVMDILYQLHVKPEFIQLVNDPPYVSESYRNIIKTKGSLKMVMIGRVHPIKGLDYLLNILKSIQVNIQLELIGWIEDRKYFRNCEEIIKELPPNIKVLVNGNFPFYKTMQKLNEAHVMVLPTKGENFGHSIFESFSAGRPVIISDQTPWRNLEEKRIGWDIPLNNHSKFKEAIEKLAAMGQLEYDLLSSKAKDFAENYIKSSGLQIKYIQLFNSSTE